jgi:hypothetical protein
MAEVKRRVIGLHKVKDAGGIAYLLLLSCSKYPCSTPLKDGKQIPSALYLPVKYPIISPLFIQGLMLHRCSSVCIRMIS